MIGKVLNNTYRLEKRLSAGGMGEVYVASHLRIKNRSFAIKRLLPELAVSEKFRERFQIEAEAMMGLNHVNIVRIEDFLIEEGAYYLVMEFVESLSLEQRIRLHGALSHVDADDLACQLLEGLDFCHGRGIIHRDLKPANLLLTSDDTLKITDFGIVRQEGGQKLTGTGTILGTPEYMSPEQIMGVVQLDGRCDLYAVGIILYEMLTGTLPFQRTEDSGSYVVLYAHMNNEPPPIPSSVPSYLRAAVKYCLKKKPDERFPSARDMLAFLEAGREAEGQLPGSTVTSRRQGQRGQRLTKPLPKNLDTIPGTPKSDILKSFPIKAPSDGTANFQRVDPGKVPPSGEVQRRGSTMGRLFRLLLLSMFLGASLAGGIWWWNGELDLSVLDKLESLLNQPPAKHSAHTRRTPNAKRTPTHKTQTPDAGGSKTPKQNTAPTPTKPDVSAKQPEANMPSHDAGAPSASAKPDAGAPSASPKPDAGAPPTPAKADAGAPSVPPKADAGAPPETKKPPLRRKKSPLNATMLGLPHSSTFGDKPPAWFPKALDDKKNKARTPKTKEPSSKSPDPRGKGVEPLFFPPRRKPPSRRDKLDPLFFPPRRKPPGRRDKLDPFFPGRVRPRARPARRFSFRQPGKWPKRVTMPCRIWLKSCVSSCMKNSSRKGATPAVYCRRTCWNKRRKEPHRILCESSLRR